MQDVLEQVVPSAEALMDETAAFRKLASSVNNCRDKASRVEVWTSDSCRRFWEVHRDNIIVILMDASINHPNTPGYVERHTHTDVVYDELSGILALDNVVKRRPRTGTDSNRTEQGGACPRKTR